MKRQQLLPFISDEKLFEQVKHVLDIARISSSEAEKRLFTNTIDPFSALFDALSQGISLRQWLEQEKSRQTQKTLQNALGDFHQEILGSIPGWVSLGKGNVFDLKNDSLKIIAEVKNKYNTTKGNHKVAIYDDLSGQLKERYRGYTAYYVEIIPRNRAVYDKPFIPSDNRTHKRRAARKDIRVIDGKSFYGIATGDPEAIRKFYEILPIVIKRILNANKFDGKYSRRTSDENIVFKDLPEKEAKTKITNNEPDCDYGELFERVY